MKTIRRFLADESTVMFVEYGLIAVVMAFVVIGAVNEAQH
jgi:Flp pilus assembly pilin Flp